MSKRLNTNQGECSQLIFAQTPKQGPGLRHCTWLGAESAGALGGRNGSSTSMLGSDPSWGEGDKIWELAVCKGWDTPVG